MDDSFSSGSFVFPINHYGYVILAAVFTFVVNFAQIVKIGLMRRKEDIPYPTLYSDKNERFNCVQRVHQVSRW